MALKINRIILRRLKRALDGAESLDSSGIPPSTLERMKPYVDHHTGVPLREAIEAIEGKRELTED